MKRILLIFLCLAGLQTAVAAGGDRAIHINQLPQPARELIKAHFANAKVSYAKIDKEIFDTSYEVVFTNGTKIEFDRKGNWTDVKSKRGIPKGVIPVRIREYLEKHHSGYLVTELELDRKGYEVKLHSGIEMKFDRQFRMRGYDD